MGVEFVYTKKMGIEKADYNGNIVIRYIMEILQKISTDSANELGFGHDLVRKNNLAWVLNKIKIRFNRPIKMGETITFYTWPLAPKHFTADRDYKAVDEKGEVVFSGISVWNLIDLSKRSLTSTEIVKDIEVDYKQERAMEDLSFNRVKLNDNYLLKYEKIIRLSEIDINDHVNNTNYFVYAQDTLTKEEYNKTIKEVEIKFNQELHLEETLQIYSFAEGNKRYIIGKKQDKEVFSTLLELDD